VYHLIDYTQKSKENLTALTNLINDSFESSESNCKSRIRNLNEDVSTYMNDINNTLQLKIKTTEEDLRNDIIYSDNEVIDKINRSLNASTNSDNKNN
jgi:hypothetical protein